MSAPRAVFFDLAGTLFSSRALRVTHLPQLRAVADAVGVQPSDDDVRAAYRRGVGVAYRTIATRAYYEHRELFAASFAAMAEALGGALDERLGLDAVVDRWTSSESARSCKPDARIYQVALNAAGCEADEVLFVGDTVEHDIAGPRAQGMATALLVADARPGAPDGGADFVIERLAEVVELVDRELVS